MLLAAERMACLPEMLIIVSGMSIQDPREQPGSQS
jgi:ATP-dependent helicase HrpA